jgi:hypothetical protein
MARVLRLDHGQGNVALVLEDVVGAADAFLVAAGLLASNEDAAVGERVLLADLRLRAPSGLL